MRDRLPGDWAADLVQRHELESRVQAALSCHAGIDVVGDSTASYERLDFQLEVLGRSGELELKAKLQPLSWGWTRLRPEVDPGDLFVIDELALRKVVEAGRFAFLLVRDEPSRRWALWSAGDLLVASRVRTSRVLRKGATPVNKGKLLLDFTEAGYLAHRLAEALDSLVGMTSQIDRWWSDVAPWPHASVGAR